MSNKRFLIIGCGFSGAVLAHELVRQLDCNVEIWDERDHVGGNCYTQRDEQTGIMIHKYGPHIFHTDNESVWKFVNAQSEFVPFVNRVKAVTAGQIYSFPINLHTINQFFSQTYGPNDAAAVMLSLSDKSIKEPRNFEEQALKFVGKEIYEAFFLGYTRKQWGCEPQELPASILKRIPIRFNYNDNYYNSKYQGIPINGYTPIIENLVKSDKIKVVLNRKFTHNEDVASFDHVFFTGPIDSYFGHRFGRLSYRTVMFERGQADGDFQGNAVINYCDDSVEYTRIHEHKHFTPWEQHDKTVFFKEYSKETGPNDIPYYPKRLSADIDKLNRYRRLAEQLSGISFLGRLATYRYMDMHQVIGEAVEFARLWVTCASAGERSPIFPNQNI